MTAKVCAGDKKKTLQTSEKIIWRIRNEQIMTGCVMIFFENEITESSVLGAGGQLKDERQK